jgi:hypothetical protein
MVEGWSVVRRGAAGDEQCRGFIDVKIL